MLYDPKVRKALRVFVIVFAILLAIAMTLAFTPIVPQNGTAPTLTF